MANLTQNLAILQKGKEDLIDEINSKLKESDQETLPIDCEWNDINNLLDKVNVKRDRSAEVDTNEIYSDICSGELNKEIITGVTNITSYSMYGQKYLPKITANNCSSVGEYAFYDCQALTDVNLPNITNIPEYCFYNNKSLKNINITKVTHINNSYAFYNCTELETISIPKIISIGNYAFQNCSRLKTIALNTEATYTIGSYAFQNCSSLETDVTEKASSISEGGIYNTGILDINSDSVISLGSYAIYKNNNLEYVSLSKLTNLTGNYTIGSNNKLKSLNIEQVRSFGTYGNNYSNSAIIYDNPELESIYCPNVTTLYGGYISNCNKLKTLSLPNAKIYHGISSSSNYRYHSAGRLIESCKELETLDLGSVEYTWTGNYNNSSSAYLVFEAYKLKNINLSSLIGAYETKTGYTGSYGARYFHLFYRVGATQLNLPSLKYANGRYGNRIAADCRNLTTLKLDALECVYSNYSTNTNSWEGSVVLGCPNLITLELPNLDTYLGSFLLGSLYTADPTNYDSVLCKKYMEKYLEAVKERYPDSYETNSDYIIYYERLHGGTIDGNIANAAPYNAGKYSTLDSNMVWCGVKTIKLPKLSSWTYNQSWTTGMFNNVQQLEEIYLGDGSFTPTTTSLQSYFVCGGIALKKVVLNYPIVLTAATTLTDIFHRCGHLNGIKYSFNYNNKTYYYENEEGLKDLYFYVPDNLVDSYKAATNWSTYAAQIRPISELADLNIDSSITSIANAEYKNNQTLTSVAGYGITSVGEEGFRSSSASSIEFANCTEVNKYAFADCPNLERVQLKYTQITNIADGVFMNSLVSFCSLPSVTTIEANAFKNTQVSTISAPVLEKIGNSAFENDLITSLSLPVVNTLGKASFKNNSISSITLPEVITINDNAFERNNLTEISIPKVTFIGNSAFKSNSITSVTLPEVTTLGKYAFAENDVQEISIPKVIMIDDYAFANNTNLESINLGTVRILGNNIFDGCTSLTDITFEGYAVPTGNLPEEINLHVRESLVEAFEEAYPNNTIIGDVE